MLSLPVCKWFILLTQSHDIWSSWRWLHFWSSYHVKHRKHSRVWTDVLSLEAVLLRGGSIWGMIVAKLLAEHLVCQASRLLIGQPWSAKIKPHTTSPWSFYHWIPRHLPTTSVVGLVNLSIYTTKEAATYIWLSKTVKADEYFYLLCQALVQSPCYCYRYSVLKLRKGVGGRLARYHLPGHTARKYQGQNLSPVWVILEF